MNAHPHNFDTLVQATNALFREGYKENFEAKEACIVAQSSKKEYQPHDLTIVDTYRFDGMTDPADEVEVFAIKASDGTKGMIVMSYSSEHSQNTDLIKQIKEDK